MHYLRLNDGFFVSLQHIAVIAPEYVLINGIQYSIGKNQYEYLCKLVEAL